MSSRKARAVKQRNPVSKKTKKQKTKQKNINSQLNQKDKLIYNYNKTLRNKRNQGSNTATLKTKRAMMRKTGNTLMIMS